MTARRRDRPIAWAYDLAILVAVGLLLGFVFLAAGGKKEPALPAEVAWPLATVEVLNGCGVKGVAWRVTKRLRAAGFDVLTYGNADRFTYPVTLVLDRIGRPELAFAVAGSLGVQEVESRPDSSLRLDVTVVVGGDWKELLHRPLRKGWWERVRGVLGLE